MFKLLQKKKIQLIIIAFLVFAAYSNIFVNGFVSDDVGYVLNWDIPKHFGNIGKILTTDSVPTDEAGVYRPVKAIFLMLSWHVWGAKPFGYHLDGLLIHIANTVLVYLIAAQLVGSGLWVVGSRKESTNYKLQAKRSERTANYLPFLTALLFGLHPIHTEAVTFLTASADSLGWLFYLGSVAAFLYANAIRIKMRMYANILSLALAFLAFFTYELTLSLPFLIVLYDLTFARGPVSSFLPASARSRVNSKVDGKSLGLLRAVGISSRTATPRRTSVVSGQLSIVRWIPYFAILGAYLFIRFVVLDIGDRGTYLGDSFYKTQLVMTFTYVQYLWLLLWPMNLSIDHKLLPGIYSVVYKAFVSSETLNALSLFSPRVLLNLGVVAGLIGGGIYFWRKLPIVSFCIFWFFITLSPAGFFLPQSTIMAERYAYLATFGFSLAAAWILCEFYANVKRIYANALILLLVIIIVVYGVRTYVRNFDYHDSLFFWQKLASQSPDNAIINYTLGKIYDERGKYDFALQYFGRALAVQPGIVEVNFRMGRDLQKLGRIDEATSRYQLAQDTQSKYSTFAQWDLARFERLSKAAHTVLAPGTFSKYQFSHVSFEYPAWWQVTRGKDSVIFDDPANLFSVEFTTFDLPAGQSLDNFVVQHQEAGTLLRTSEAVIDHFDRGIAQFFKDDDIERLEFFLQKKQEFVHIWVYPLNSTSIAEFDRMLGTMDSQ